MAGRAPFSFWTFFFSLRGRVTRAAFAWFELPAALYIFGAPLLLRAYIQSGLSSIPIQQAAPLFLLTGLPTLLFLWPRFAVLVKRCHDAGLSWAFALPVWSPLVYSLAVFAATVTGNYFDADGLRHPLLFQVAGYVVTALNYGSILLGCLLPPRPQGDRYGPDPRRPGSATSDIF